KVSGSSKYCNLLCSILLYLLCYSKLFYFMPRWIILIIIFKASQPIPAHNYMHCFIYFYVSSSIIVYVWLVFIYSICALNTHIFISIFFYILIFFYHFLHHFITLHHHLHNSPSVYFLASHF